MAEAFSRKAPLNQPVEPILPQISQEDQSAIEQAMLGDEFTGVSKE